MATRYGATPGGATPDDVAQEAVFEEARSTVIKHAFFMKRALDDENLQEALKNASNMIFELRSPKLFPTKYYELYMDVTNELHHLESFISDEFQKQMANNPQEAQTWITELYEQVQHAGNIIPRLYLLMTVAAVQVRHNRNNKLLTYIARTDIQSPVMKILFDLVELTKGVQHPTRGLFLRNYLSQISKTAIPDIPDGVEAEAATSGRSAAEVEKEIEEAIDFVLHNFGEMTRLWVRMQHQGAVRDRAKREQERMQLRMLVGTNLRRLSELNAVTKDRYAKRVLPELCEQIIKCKDKIAQEYLMDCIIHVFADEYHLATLDKFLQTCSQLQSAVNVKDVIVSLMNRLSAYARDNDGAFADRDVFPTFQKNCADIVEKAKKMKLEDKLSVQTALVNFASSCYPGKDDYVKAAVTVAAGSLKTHREKREKKGKSTDLSKGEKALVKQLMTAPLHAVGLRVLDIEEYPTLVNYLDFNSHRQVSQDIVRNLVQKSGVYLDQADRVEKLFSIILPIIQDLGETPPLTDDNRYEFEDEQHLMARLLTLIQNKSDTDAQYETLLAARTFLQKGGGDRLVYTLPPLIFNCLHLIRGTWTKEQDGADVRIKSKKMFRFVHQVLKGYGPHNPILGVRYYLQAGLEADRCSYDNICYEFITQAVLMYEEDVSDSHEQFLAVSLLSSTISQLANMTFEAFDTLRAKTTQHSNRLLKKPAQARAVYQCAHLYWCPQMANKKSEDEDAEEGARNEERVVKCLQRALKVARNIMQPVDKINLFTEILNKYVYFLVEGCSSINPEHITNLAKLIQELVGGLDDDADEDGNLAVEARNYFQNSIKFIKDKQQDGGDDAELCAKYKLIELES